HQRQVQRAVGGHVAGVAAAPRDESLILLAAPRNPDLGDGHAAPPCAAAAAAGAGVVLLAASCTALTMFWYPVQRHRLPSSPSRTVCSSGFGCSRTTSIDCMIMPGVQKPHCRAWHSWNA